MGGTYDCGKHDEGLDKGNTVPWKLEPGSTMDNDIELEVLAGVWIKKRIYIDKLNICVEGTDYLLTAEG